MSNRAPEREVGIIARDEYGVCVLAVDGELRDATARELRERVEESFARDGRDFVIDFGEATGIDSAGLEALTWLKRECDERLGLLKLCNLPDPFKVILEMTRLDRRFDQYEFLEDALQSFA